MKDVLAHMAGLSPVVVAVRSRHPRSVTASAVAESARAMGLQVVGEYEVAAEGVERAVRIARRGDIVLGTGSLSVAAEMTEKVCGTEPELYPSLKLPKASAKGV
jgi:folylpolyglutamate synthase/dihydropteroate synthase